MQKLNSYGRIAGLVPMQRKRPCTRIGYGNDLAALDLDAQRKFLVKVFGMYLMPIVIKKLDRYVGSGFAGFDGKRSRHFSFFHANDFFAADNEYKAFGVGMLIVVIFGGIVTGNKPGHDQKYNNGNAVMFVYKHGSSLVW